VQSVAIVQVSKKPIAAERLAYSSTAAANGNSRTRAKDIIFANGFQ